MDLESSILFARLSIEELEDRRAFTTDDSELLAISEQENYLRMLIAELELDQAQASAHNVGSSQTQLSVAEPWNTPSAPVSPILQAILSSGSRPISSPVAQNPPSTSTQANPLEFPTAPTLPSPALIHLDVRPFEEIARPSPADTESLRPFEYIFRTLPQAQINTTAPSPPLPPLPPRPASRRSVSPPASPTVHHITFPSPPPLVRQVTSSPPRPVSSVSSSSSTSITVHRIGASSPPLPSLPLRPTSPLRLRRPASSSTSVTVHHVTPPSPPLPSIPQRVPSPPQLPRPASPSTSTTVHHITFSPPPSPHLSRRRAFVSEPTAVHPLGPRSSPPRVIPQPRPIIARTPSPPPIEPLGNPSPTPVAPLRIPLPPPIAQTSPTTPFGVTIFGFPTPPLQSTSPTASSEPIAGPSRRQDDPLTPFMRILSAFRSPTQEEGPSIGNPTIRSPNNRHNPFRDPDDDDDGLVHDVPALSPSVSSTSSVSLNEDLIPQPVFQKAPQVCIACTERKPPALEAPCHHYFCSTCLHEQIRNIVYKDQFSYPFRCCKDWPMSVEMITPHLSPNLRMAFEVKSKELSVPLLERAYCKNPKCAAFLGRLDALGRYTICETCFKLNCTEKLTSTSEELARLAKANKWQACYHCQMTIEQRPGCDHIQCVCGAEFCYACGAKWKTCACPYWTEDRLIAEVERL